MTTMFQVARGASHCATFGGAGRLERQSLLEALYLTCLVRWTGLVAIWQPGTRCGTTAKPQIGLNRVIAAIATPLQSMGVMAFGNIWTELGSLDEPSVVQNLLSVQQYKCGDRAH